MSDIENTTAKLNRVLQSVKKWMDFKHLKLNENKTEYTLVGKKDNLRNLGIINMNINGNDIHVTDKVRDFSVLLNCNLTLSNQINNCWTSSKKYHIC